MEISSRGGLSPSVITHPHPVTDLVGGGIPPRERREVFRMRTDIYPTLPLANIEPFCLLRCRILNSTFLRHRSKAFSCRYLPFLFLSNRYCYRYRILVGARNEDNMFESQQSTSYGVITTLFIMTTISILLRIYSRRLVLKSFGWDDWCMFTILVSPLPLSGC